MYFYETFSYNFDFIKKPYEYDLNFFYFFHFRKFIMEDNDFEFENVIIKSEDKSLSEQDPEMIDNMLTVKKEEEHLNEADFKYERLVIIVLQYMKIENSYSLVFIRGYVGPFGAHSATHD